MVKGLTMIRSFSDDEAEKIWNGQRSRKLPADIQQRAFRRLQLIDAASILPIWRYPSAIASTR